MNDQGASSRQILPSRYVDTTKPPRQYFCISCRQFIPAVEAVQQECSCRLISCNKCLRAWETIQGNRSPPMQATCFQCREALNLSALSQIPTPVTPARLYMLLESIHTHLVRRENMKWMEPGPEYLALIARFRAIRPANFGPLHILDTFGTLPTFYAAPSVPIQELFLIRGRYHIPLAHTEYLYYFWVHPSTEIGELGVLWNKVSRQLGTSEPPFDERVWTHNEQIPLGEPAWTYNGQIMEWTYLVGDVGMAHGSSFEIVYERESEWLARRSYGMSD